VPGYDSEDQSDAALAAGAVDVDRHRAVCRLGDRSDHLGAAVDVGVVEQHIDGVGARVLAHGGGVIDRDRRIERAAVAH